MSDIATKVITVADNTAAVAEAVNAAKVTVSGAVVRADDVLNSEHGLQVQLHSDTVTDFSSVGVTVFGKNLIPLEETEPYTKTQIRPFLKAPFTLRAGVTYTMSAFSSSVPTALYFNDSVSGDSLAYKTQVSQLSCTPEEDCQVYLLYYWKEGIPEDVLLQLEVGEATEYEAYKAPQTATADANGKVKGLLSVAPAMTLLTDTVGVTVEGSYFPESSADTYAKYQELKQEQTALQEKLQEYLQEESTNE